MIEQRAGARISVRSRASAFGHRSKDGRSSKENVGRRGRAFEIPPARIVEELLRRRLEERRRRFPVHRGPCEQKRQAGCPPIGQLIEAVRNLAVRLRGSDSYYRLCFILWTASAGPIQVIETWPLARSRAKTGGGSARLPTTIVYPPGTAAIA